MGDEERARILRMVSEGKLSPEEAADLLEAVETEGERERRGPRSHGSMAPMPPMPAMPRGGRTRFLVIHVREGGDNKVNLRIPLNLTRAAGKFIPRKAHEYLSKYEIDLNEFVHDVSETDSGTILEVKDGENKVLIAVE